MERGKRKSQPGSQEKNYRGIWFESLAVASHPLQPD
jgi:hypothetical protein